MAGETMTQAEVSQFLEDQGIDIKPTLHAAKVLIDQSKEITTLRSRVEALESVVRELVAGMSSITGSGGISKSVHITVDYGVWTKATALLALPANEGTPERKGGE